MSISAPASMSTAQFPKLQVPAILQYGEEEEEEFILSDIDPELFRELKNPNRLQPSGPESNTPQNYVAQIDSAEDQSGPRPLAANSFVNFEGPDNLAQPDGFLHKPPDGGMASGQNHVVVSVNSLIAIYTKTGSLVYFNSLANWFSLSCTVCKPFDPRVIYDPVAGRWIVLAVDGNSSTSNISNYLLSVSQTSDPTGAWWFYSFNGVLSYPPTGENTWADFPHLGFDGIPASSGGAIYVTSNQFTFGGAPSFRTTVLNILPKTSLYGGMAVTYWRAWDRLNADGSQVFTLSPALTYGNPGGEFFINSRNTGSTVSLWKVVPTYPPTAVNWTLQSTNNIGAYTFPPEANQPGGCALLATNDNRISANAVWRNNKIYAGFTEGHNWGSGNVAALRFVQLDTSTNATDHNVTFGADGLSYFFPAIATDGSSNVVMTFARAGATEFGSIRHTGRLAGEPVNTLQGSAQLKSGAECITAGRWGDYFAAAVDPADTSKVWIFGEWAKDLPGVGADWDWGTWLGQVGFGPRRTRYDYTGDGRADIGVWRGADGTWYIINSATSGVLTQQWGNQSVGDVPVAGDFDGDGRFDYAIWRPPSGTWYIIKSSNGTVQTQQWGNQSLGDVPAPGDFDGDGKTDIAIWRASSGTWYIINSSTSTVTQKQWGVLSAGDRPVAGDYDGDARADIAIWRASTGTWYIVNSSTNVVTTQQWGNQSLGDVPVIGDFDGDNRTDISVWRASNGTWYMIFSSDGLARQRQWGVQSLQDKPVPADFDGDGKTDIAIWRGANGIWYIINNSNGIVITQQWGNQSLGDIPTPAF